MTSLRDLVSGDTIIDTAFRALAMTIFLAITIALVWTTHSVRKDSYAFEPNPNYQSSIQLEKTFLTFRKELIP